jgi:hypothetical protein
MMFERRRRGPGTRLMGLAMALAVLMAGVVAAPAAQAKTPSRSPEATVKCANGKKAKIWYQGTKRVYAEEDRVEKYWTLTQFAVDNRCKDWLLFTMVSDPHSESDCCWWVQVAPGANFTKTAKDVPSADLFGGEGSRPFSVREVPKACRPDDGLSGPNYDVAKNGKVTSTPLCPRKHPESESRSVGCPESWDPTYGYYREQSYGIWKVDDNRILKLAATNRCDFEMIYWWKTKDGKRIALWVEANSSFDLWKDELDPLPVKTKDGAVYFIDGPRMAPTLADTAAYDQNWRIADGRPYRWQTSR